MDVFLYVRVSTTEQGKKHSLEAQTDELRSYCMEKGHSIIGIYSDKKSGMTMDRDGLQSVLDNIGKADSVLVTEWDRLTRHPDHKVIIKYEIKRAGKNILAINETSRESSEFEEFTERMIALINWWENKRRAMRAERGRKKALEKGVQCHRPPLAQTDYPKFVRVMELRAKGTGYHKIAKIVGMSVSSVYHICSKSISYRTP
jgi:DNA invertase Pin-like site-specific DNA recombinase